jgi:hypothetical protein
LEDLSGEKLDVLLQVIHKYCNIPQIFPNFLSKSSRHLPLKSSGSLPEVFPQLSSNFSPSLPPTLSSFQGNDGNVYTHCEDVRCKHVKEKRFEKHTKRKKVRCNYRKLQTYQYAQGFAIQKT